MKLLLQIGKRGAFDTENGTALSPAQNSNPEQLNRPAGVAIDGDIYIADGYGNRRVAVFDRNGKVLSAFGGAGHQAGHFVHAHSIAADSNGSIYVTGTNLGRRVQRFRPVAASR